MSSRVAIALLRWKRVRIGPWLIPACSTIGGILGLLTAGPFSDFVVRRSAKKNAGVREAEMRLPALVPYTLLMTLGVTLGGLAYQRHWPWPVILIFGYAGAGLAVTSIPVSIAPLFAPTKSRGNPNAT